MSRLLLLRPIPCPAFRCYWDGDDSQRRLYLLFRFRLQVQGCGWQHPCFLRNLCDSVVSGQSDWSPSITYTRCALGPGLEHQYWESIFLMITEAATWSDSQRWQPPLVSPVSSVMQWSVSPSIHLVAAYITHMTCTHAGASMPILRVHLKY